MVNPLRKRFITKLFREQCAMIDACRNLFVKTKKKCRSVECAFDNQPQLRRTRHSGTLTNVVAVVNAVCIVFFCGCVILIDSICIVVRPASILGLVEWVGWLGYDN